jgi:Glycosyl hydrolase catalytic core
MKIGLTWPTDGPDDFPPEPEHFALIKAAGFDMLRFNLHHDRTRENAGEWIRACEAAGLEPLVILDGTYSNPNIPIMASLAKHLVATYNLPVLEIMNEPWILHKMPAATYAAVVTVVKDACPQTKLILGAEVTKPRTQPLFTNLRNRLRQQTYFDEVKQLLHPDDWDILAIHPYSNPAPLTSNDLRIYSTKTTKPIWITELGWHHSEQSDEQVAANTWNSLTLCETRNVPVVCFYAMVGDPTKPPDWGFWGPDWQERPVVEMIRRWKA